MNPLSYYIYTISVPLSIPLGGILGITSSAVRTFIPIHPRITLQLAHKNEQKFIYSVNMQSVLHCVLFVSRTEHKRTDRGTLKTEYNGSQTERNQDHEIATMR